MSVLRRGGWGPLAPAAARLGVVVAGLRLGLAPGLVAAAALLALLGPRHGRLVRWVCVGATLAAPALLAIGAGSPLSGGRFEHSFGEPVAGFPILLRADGPALVLAGMAVAGTLAALGAPGRRGQECGALMLCLLGALLTALSGTVLGLFVGLEAGNAGALLLMSAGRPRPGRSARTVHALEFLAALGLLVAAVELQVGRGTGDLIALADLGLPALVAVPWALAGVARLLGPAVAPGLARPGGGLAWTAAAALPSGLAVLLRLLEASGGDLGLPPTALLAFAGTAAALAGAVAALRATEAAAAGRALCVSAAGSAVAMAGIAGDGGRFALAAGALALQLSLIAAPLWRGRSGWSAISLAMAGGLPVGAGTTAVILELNAAAARGISGSPVLLGTGVAAVLAAAAAARAVRQRLAARTRAPAVRWDAVAAVAASFAAAVLPGALVGGIASRLAGGGGVTALDAGAIRGPGGGWAGGYLVLAALVTAAGAASWLVLAGTEATAAEPASDGIAARSWSVLLGPRRLARPALRPAGRALAGVDDWLVGQPQLVWVVAAIALTVLLLR